MYWRIKINNLSNLPLINQSDYTVWALHIILPSKPYLYMYMSYSRKLKKWSLHYVQAFSMDLSIKTTGLIWVEKKSSFNNILQWSWYKTNRAKFQSSIDHRVNTLFSNGLVLLLAQQTNKPPNEIFTFNLMEPPIVNNNYFVFH